MSQGVLGRYVLLKAEPYYEVSVNGQTISKTRGFGPRRTYAFYILFFKVRPPPMVYEVNGKLREVPPDPTSMTVTVETTEVGKVRIHSTREELEVDRIDSSATISIPAQRVEFYHKNCLAGKYTVTNNVGGVTTSFDVEVKCEQVLYPTELKLSGVVVGRYVSVPYPQYIWITGTGEYGRWHIYGDYLYNISGDSRVKKGNILPTWQEAGEGNPGVHSTVKTLLKQQYAPYSSGAPTEVSFSNVTVGLIPGFAYAVSGFDVITTYPGGGQAIRPGTDYSVDKYLYMTRFRVYYRYGYVEPEYGADVPVGCEDFKSLTVEQKDYVTLRKVDACTWEVEVSPFFGFRNYFDVPFQRFNIYLRGMQWSDRKGMDSVTIGYDLLRTSDSAVDSALSAVTVTLNDQKTDRTGSLTFKL